MGSHRTSSKHVVAIALASSLMVLGLEITVVRAVRAHEDRAQFVESSQLVAALQIFRPAEHAGLATPLDSAELAADRSVRTQPARCARLTLLATQPALDAQTWTGVNGSPAQPVSTLTVRYASARTARAELTAKRSALLSCRTLRLTFPPFDGPAETFTVTERHWLLSAVGDRVVYELSGQGKRYDFYVRRYANTLTWTYADDVSTPKTRQQVADQLITRLEEITAR